MSKFELNAELRGTAGRGASRRLRRENKVPGIMYGGGEAVQSLIFNQFQLKKALENEAFYTRILTIHIDGKPHQAVLKDLQHHPYRTDIMHLDLLRITGKEKISMQIPLHFTGGDVAPGVKTDGGLISHLISTVEIRCLPAHLPEYITVDLSDLKLNESIHLSQLKLPEGVELTALLHGNDKAVVNIHMPRIEVEEDLTAAPVSAEVPAIAQKSPEELAKEATANKEAKEKEKGKK